MRKSISNPALSTYGVHSASSARHVAPQVIPIPRRSSSNTSLNSLGNINTHTLPPSPPEVVIEAVAEAIARTALPNIALCTELYGFPNELVHRDRDVVTQYVSCLMQPDEPIEPSELPEFELAFGKKSSTTIYNTERMARWFRIERRRKRRWSFIV